MYIYTSLAVHGLKCYCAHFIDGVELLSLPCTNNVCETSGVCVVELKSRNGQLEQVFTCLNNFHGISTIGIACTISEPEHVFQCCNETDYCNEDLSPTLPPAVVSDMSPPTTDSKGTQSLEAEIYMYKVYTIMVIIVRLTIQCWQYCMASLLIYITIACYVNYKKCYSTFIEGGKYSDRNYKDFIVTIYERMEFGCELESSKC